MATIDEVLFADSLCLKYDCLNIPQEIHTPPVLYAKLELEPTAHASCKILRARVETRLDSCWLPAKHVAMHLEVPTWVLGTHCQYDWNIGIFYYRRHVRISGKLKIILPAELSS